mgnify:CR=1 FL=1
MKRLAARVRQRLAPAPPMDAREVLMLAFCQHLLYLTTYVPPGGTPMSLEEAMAEVRGGREFGEMAGSILMEAVAAVKAVSSGTAAPDRTPASRRE